MGSATNGSGPFGRTIPIWLAALPPFVSLGTDEADAIVRLIGSSPQATLNVLEQAKFVVELLSVHQRSLAEVAQTVSRSKAWVSMRNCKSLRRKPGDERDGP